MTVNIRATANPFSIIIAFVFAAFTANASEILSAGAFKVYPLADEYFEKIYVVQQSQKKLYLTISCKQANTVSISLTETINFEAHPRYNVYGNIEPKPLIATDSYTLLKECPLDIELDQEHFIAIKRKGSPNAFFAIDRVNFSNLHNSFKVTDHSTKWGLGERFQEKFRVIDGKWTLWNRDKPWKVDRGQPTVSDQTYGFQPVYLARCGQSKLYHLVYFKNTFALQVEASHDANELLFHSMAGPLHFIVILGSEHPEPLLQQYHSLIGASHIPPFWSLGYHQCRWGYKTADKLIDVLSRFENHDLPIDTIWSDLDYMQQKRIFTVGPTHKGKLNNMMQQFEVHFIPLLDVGVSIHDSNAMVLGKDLRAFIRTSYNPNEYYVGEVWPGAVHFVDYLHPNASSFWKQQMQRLYEQVQFSGIWIDMNEPSNFRGNEPTTQTFRFQKNEGINQMTINVDLPHYSDRKQKLTHRQVHTYYGHLSTIPIHEFLKQKGKRPFIISRSNSVGSGVFAGHWTGDNVASWQFLRLSINGNFLFQIFGVQMVGADICGFNQNTNEELCARWTQLGCFYPFSRNHNVDNAIDQEPYSFTDLLLNTSRQSIKTKYALLKHMYTVMVKTQGKGSYFRPLNFEFPLDQKVYVEETIETQFLIGNSLMVAPIVYERTIQRKVYFPGQGQSWHSFIIDIGTGKAKPDSLKAYLGNSESQIDNPMPSHAPTFLRAGHLLLTNKPQRRAKRLSSRFNLLAALKSGKAVGYIMSIADYDDEPSISVCISGGCYMRVTLTRTESSKFVLEWSYEGDRSVLSQISLVSIQVVQQAAKWSVGIDLSLSGPAGAITLELNPY